MRYTQWLSRGPSVDRLACLNILMCLTWKDKHDPTLTSCDLDYHQNLIVSSFAFATHLHLLQQVREMQNDIIICTVLHVNSTCATHTPHNSWRSLISGGCRASMNSLPQLVSGCAFSSCLSTGTEDCAVPVVLSGWLTICFVLSASDELSRAWLLTLTESDCTVVLQQKCDNATLIILISIVIIITYMLRVVCV